jgi:hypothetical protein
MKGFSFPGYIADIKIDKKGIEQIAVDSVNGLIQKLSRADLKYRIVQDLSKVEISEEKKAVIKKMNTIQLLEELRYVRVGGRSIFTMEQIKAELATRPHIKSKKERKHFPNKKK